jgi:hypothetical protein
MFKILTFFDADPDPGSGIFLTLDPGSGMQKFGSGIRYKWNIPDPQHNIILRLFVQGDPERKFLLDS